VFVGEVPERLHAHLTGVVDDDVDGTERVERASDDRVSALCRGDGVVVGDSFTTGGDDLRDDLVGGVGGRRFARVVGVADGDAEIVDDDPRAPTRQE
jgi:hypothetical protein